MPKINQLSMLMNKDHRQHHKYNSMFMKTRGKFTLIPKNQNLWLNDNKVVKMVAREA